MIGVCRLYEPLYFRFDADLLDVFGQMVANRQVASQHSLPDYNINTEEIKLTCNQLSNHNNGEKIHESIIHSYQCLM